MSKVIFEAYIDTIVGLLKMILHATRYNSSMYVCTAYSLHNELKSKKNCLPQLSLTDLHKKDHIETTSLFSNQNQCKKCRLHL